MVKKHRVRAHHRPSRPIPTWLIAAICLGAWAAHLPALYRYQTAVSDDGASYVEAARSVLAGRGLTVRLHNSLKPQLWEPLTIWPPGYPLLLAGLQRAGLTEPQSWAAATAGSVAIFILLVVWITSKLLPPALALAVSLVTALMPTLLEASVFIMSDPTYMALATGSVACLVAWARRPNPSPIQSLAWLAAAGLLAGLSWGIRYAAVALWAATAAWLFAHFLWSSWRRTLAQAVIWGTGLLLGAGPFMLRNLRVAGEMTPYHMGPSELSVWDNIRMTLHMLLLDLTRWQSGVDGLMRRVPTDVLLAALAMFLAWLWLRPMSPAKTRAALAQHRIPLFLALYLTIHLAMLIAARSKYRWGAFIDTRVALPVYWIIWMGVAATLRRLAGKLQRNQRLAADLAVAAILGLTVLQLRDYDDHVRFLRTTVSGASPNVMAYAFGEPTIQALKQEIGPDQVVLATRAFVLRIHADLNARQFLPEAKTDSDSILTLEEIRHAGQTGLLWGLIIDDRMRAGRGDFGTLIQDITNHPERFPEFQRVHPDSPALILRYSP